MMDDEMMLMAEKECVAYQRLLLRQFDRMINLLKNDKVKEAIEMLEDLREDTKAVIEE